MKNCRSFLYRSSSHVISGIEWVCGGYGAAIARRPWTAIGVCVLAAILAGSGLTNLTFEYRPYKLWVKEPSEFKKASLPILCRVVIIYLLYFYLFVM